jgi:hypothetical protein
MSTKMQAMVMVKIIFLLVDVIKPRDFSYLYPLKLLTQLKETMIVAKIWTN